MGTPRPFNSWEPGFMTLRHVKIRRRKGVSVFRPFEDILEYFSSKPELMDPVGMEFHEPDYCYVLIVQGDEFPCVARP